MTGVDAAVEDLWREFKATGDQDLRNQLVLQYSPLVKYVSGRVRSGLPQNIDSSDLVSEGVIGLMDAIDRFDLDRGLQFQTYAVPRIRGAIIDSIRAADWVPRSVRTRIKLLDTTRADFQQEHGRSPDDHELADRSGLSVSEVREARQRATGVTHADDEELADLYDGVPDLDETFEDVETRTLLLQAVRGMSEREQVVIALYFFEGLTLGEIGQVLDVTESRVSQLRARATGNLRAALVELLHQE